MQVWRFVDNLRLHVFEMRHLPKEVRELFQSDMRIVVDYLAEGTSYCSGQKVIHKAALVRMIHALSGEQEDAAETERQLEEMEIREEDEITVCELFDQYTRKGRQEGREEGLAEGRTEGRKEGLEEGLKKGMQKGMQKGMKRGEARRLVTDIEKLMKNLHLTLEKACEVFETSVGSYEAARKLLGF